MKNNKIEYTNTEDYDLSCNIPTGYYGDHGSRYINSPVTRKIISTYYWQGEMIPNELVEDDTDVLYIKTNYMMAPVHTDIFIDDDDTPLPSMHSKPILFDSQEDADYKGDKTTMPVNISLEEFVSYNKMEVKSNDIEDFLVKQSIRCADMVDDTQHDIVETAQSLNIRTMIEADFAPLHFDVTYEILSVPNVPTIISNRVCDVWFEKAEFMLFSKLRGICAHYGIASNDHLLAYLRSDAWKKFFSEDQRRFLIQQARVNENYFLKMRWRTRMKRMNRRLLHAILSVARDSSRGIWSFCRQYDEWKDQWNSIWCFINDLYYYGYSIAFLCHGVNYMLTTINNQLYRYGLVPAEVIVTQWDVYLLTDNKRYRLVNAKFNRPYAISDEWYYILSFLKPKDWHDVRLVNKAFYYTYRHYRKYYIEYVSYRPSNYDIGDAQVFDLPGDLLIREASPGVKIAYDSGKFYMFVVEYAWLTRWLCSATNEEKEHMYEFLDIKAISHTIIIFSELAYFMVARGSRELVFQIAARRVFKDTLVMLFDSFDYPHYVPQGVPLIPRMLGGYTSHDIRIQ